jgi:hypothetical protein
VLSSQRWSRKDWLSMDRQEWHAMGWQSMNWLGADSRDRFRQGCVWSGCYGTAVNAGVAWGKLP